MKKIMVIWGVFLMCFLTGCGSTTTVIDLNSGFNINYESGKQYEYSFGKRTARLSLSTEDDRCYYIYSEPDSWVGDYLGGEVILTSYYSGTYSEQDDGSVLCSFDNKFLSVTYGSDFDVAKMRLAIATMGAHGLDTNFYTKLYIDRKVVQESEDGARTATLEVQLGEEERFLPMKLEREIYKEAKTLQNSIIQMEILRFDGEHYIALEDKRGGEERVEYYYNEEGIIVARKDISTIVYGGGEMKEEKVLEVMETYDANGNIQTKTEWHDGCIIEKEYYDEQGEMLEANYSYFSGVKDSDGNMIQWKANEGPLGSIIWRNEDGKQIKEDIHIYDIIDDKHKENVDNWKLVCIKTMSHNQITAVIMYNSSGEEIAKYEIDRAEGYYTDWTWNKNSETGVIMVSFREKFLDGKEGEYIEIIRN